MTRILALDVGAKRIGIAVSDPTGSMAQPLMVLDRRKDSSEIGRISELVDEYSVSEVVVGLPLSLAGEMGPQAREVLDYINELKGNLKVPVRTWDERLTTSFAERALVESDVRRKQRKQVIDKVAATLILQGYLDYRGQKERKAESG
ncbi:MAG TPA: Holliday junction resolvase RuvX [Anaerolineae bacterium]|jgi:putative Holliday junction resolvase|nr:Holliday junction resolvase RuvX [Anaerolineae bacterium]